MKKKAVGINLPDVPVGPRRPQLPITCYPITSEDVIEVIARGITDYMNERLTKFHAIAYNPENIALRKVNEQCETDLVKVRRENAALQAEITAFRAEKAVWDTIRATVRAEVKEEDLRKAALKKKPARKR